MEPTKILMVCLGNICRSPLAQGILESKITSNTVVDSAGTAAYHVEIRLTQEASLWQSKTEYRSVSSAPENLQEKILKILIIFM